MKNVYLYIVFLLIGFNSFGQGTDIIFAIDNTSSIIGDVNDSNSEYGQIYNSIQQLMNSTLNCNSYNRVTVMQYYEGNIYLESAFTNNVFSFPRRWNACCTGMYSSLDRLSDALNGIINPNVQSPIKTLTQSPGNKLVVYFFTDAGRGSDLLAGNPPIGVNNNSGFATYTNFKNNFGAKVFIAINPLDTDALKAAASIASVGGTYSSLIEPYSADPDGAGVLPRYLIQISNSFLFTIAQIQTVTDQICSLGCVPDLVLSSPIHNVLSTTQDNRQASNTITASNVINNDATGIYHAAYDVVLKPGFSSANGSVFRAYIEGCSDEFEGLKTSEEESMRTASIEEEKELFTLYPNPTVESVTITSDKVMQNITVSSLDGFTLFQRDIMANSFELNVSNYKKGIYLINVITEDGQMEMKKLIKE